MSEDHTPKSAPPPASRAQELKSAANALVGWFNMMETKPADAKAIMSLVMAKIISDTTRIDVYALHEEMDATMVQLAHDINNRLFQKRSDIRLGKDKPNG